MSLNWTTLLFELVNFVVLVWLLNLLVFRPLRRGIARRRERMEEEEARTEERLEEAHALQGRAEKRMAELGEVEAEIKRKASEEASEERARIVQQARDDAESERARARSLLEAERKAAEAWVLDAAVTRGAEVAGRLLTDLAPEGLHERLVSLLVDELPRHADEIRESAAGEEGEAPDVELVAARAVGEEQLDAMRGALREILGSAPGVETSEDDSLRAGAVLTVGAQVFDGSLKGQLDAFRARARALAEAETEAAGA